MRLIRTYRPERCGSAPFGGLHALRDEINRLFDVPSGEWTRSGDFLPGWAPVLDLHEDKDSFIATVELPGMKREQIDVSVHDGVLSVSGERARAAQSGETDCYRSERNFGRFHRAISLPKPVRLDGIRAAYRDGLLTVTMPKTEDAKPKQIQVSDG